MTEFQRFYELACGAEWIGDPKRLLYCCLANIAPKNNHLVEFDGTIPPSYEEAAKLLYQVVGQSEAEELKSQGYDMAAERICSACLDYLQTVMAPDDFASFKASTPTRKFKSIMEELQQMLEEAR